MAYASLDDIVMAVGGPDRLVQLADWDNDGVVDDAVIAAAQVAADALIDSYARMRYATPIANPSATIRSVAAQEAVYQIRHNRGMAGQSEIDERAQRIEWLRDLSRGAVRPDEPAPSRSTAVKPVFIESTRDLSRLKTRGFW